MSTGPFVGRAEQMALLGRVLADARAGRGRVVAVVGETGIGKSRLLTEVGGVASAAGMVVLTGRAVRGSGPYRPLAEALAGFLRAGSAVDPARLGPYAAVLGGLLPDLGGRARDGRPEPGPAPLADPAVVLGEAVARYLAEAGRDRGCLMVLEDLHWSDPDTLAVVQHLAAAVSDLPVAVAVSGRDDEPASDAVSRLLATRDVLPVPLDRLPSSAVAEWVRAVRTPDTATLRDLDERADGLPLLVEELLKVHDDDPVLAGGDGSQPRTSSVPPTFAAMVAERVARLSAAHRRVLTAAAVLGPQPDWTLLSLVSGGTDDQVVDALGAATDLHLLESDAATLRWRHAMTRDAVLGGTLPPERAAMARRAAEALLARRVNDDDDAAAADLLLEAGASARAADLMLDLAARDASSGARRTAEALLDRVEATGERPVGVATGRVRLFCLMGRAAEALAAGAPALDVATGAEHAELALRLARAAVLAGRWDQAGGYVERAGRPADPRSAAVLADAAHGAGRVDEATGHAAEAVARAEGTGRPDALCEALLVAARLARLHDLDAADAGFRRAAQIAAEHGLRAWRVEAMTGVGTVEVLRDETSPTLAEAHALAAESGLLGHLAALDMIIASCVLLAEGPGAAEQVAHELVDRGARLRLPAAEAAGRFLLALGPAAAGRTGEMDRALSAWEFPAEAGPEAAFMPAAVRAVAALVARDLPGATRLLDEAIGPLVAHRSAAPLHEFGLWALLRTVTSGGDGDARETVRSLPAGLRRANRAALLYADAVVAGRAGRAVEAAESLAAAEHMLAALPWLRRLLRLPTLDSAVTDGWGEPVPLLRVSLAEHEEAGEHLPARTCRDLLRRAGAPTRRGRGTTAVPPELTALGVTSREMDVLALVSEGATNAQVADRLFLSPRTVETHVASLLAKTGASSREELRRRARRAQTP